MYQCPCGPQMITDGPFQRRPAWQALHRQLRVPEHELDRFGVLRLPVLGGQPEALLEPDDVGVRGQIPLQLRVEQPGMAQRGTIRLLPEVPGEELGGQGERTFAGLR